MQSQISLQKPPVFVSYRLLPRDLHPHPLSSPYDHGESQRGLHRLLEPHAHEPRNLQHQYHWRQQLRFDLEASLDIES